MECGRCGKSRQVESYCKECKKIRKQQSNLRYRMKKSISRSLRKRLGI